MDHVAIEHKPLDVLCECVAFWPEFVEADACFQKAGFESFLDTDEEWDNVWPSVLNSFFDGFEKSGKAFLVAGEVPVKKTGFFRKESGTLRDALECASQDDQFPTCCVGFGDPCWSYLLTSDGHPIIWAFPEGPLNVANWLKSLELPVQLEHKKIEWSFLTPRGLHIVG